MAPIDVPNFDALFQLFPDSADKPTAEVISPEQVPAPYHDLLVHEEHMTVKVESHYGEPVDVQVLDCRMTKDEYARKILLALRDKKTVVQFGLPRIDLTACPAPVRDAILEGKTPLGRVLIEHNMLRSIKPTAFLRVRLGDVMARWFGSRAGDVTYGRLGVISTGDRPVIEVLEILAPIGDS